MFTQKLTGDISKSEFFNLGDDSSKSLIIFIKVFEFSHCIQYELQQPHLINYKICSLETLN